MQYDLIVIGAGMFGSAAARHAAMSGARVALVGPSEPADHAAATGPFASHYDEGRITRRLDPDPDWARIADQAIGRYPALAAQAGFGFHKPCGVLITGPEQHDGTARSDLVPQTRQVCVQMGLPVEALDHAALGARFPQFAHEAGFVGLFEAGDAGVINPRAMVDAQVFAAEHAGAHYVQCAAQDLHQITGGWQVDCADGSQLTGAKVILATGIYGQIGDMSRELTAQMGCTIRRRTVTLFEMDADEAARLADLPCLIFVPETRDSEPYLLPPVPYPDGKLWLKIGGEPESDPLRDEAEAREWFQSGGSAAAMDYQTRMIEGLMPGLRFASRQMKACAYTKTPTERPIVQALQSGLYTCFGGNGMGAKGSDEIGRIGAALALDGAIPDGYAGDFTAG